ncbi:MAG: transporter [Alphaproteobacteria bacterium]|nr:transporter [Alphaproteobacteria bacterium]
MIPLALAWVLGHPAWACATCAAGDPTLTSMGLEKPTAGRVRLASQVAYRWEREQDEAVVDQIRGELAVSWTAARWVVLSGTVPLVTQARRPGDLSEQRGTGLGDAELRARFVVGTSRLRSHLGGLVAGLELPTGAAIRREDGSLASKDVQVGAGAVTPVFGGWYGGFHGAWSSFASATLRSSTIGFEGRRPGVAGLATVAVQWQPHHVVAPRLAVDARVSAADAMDEIAEPDTGGWLVQLTPALLLSPSPDWLVQLAVPVPVAQGGSEGTREGVGATLAVVVDL